MTAALIMVASLALGAGVPAESALLALDNEIQAQVERIQSLEQDLQALQRRKQNLRPAGQSAPGIIKQWRLGRNTSALEKARSEIQAAHKSLGDLESQRESLAAKAREALASLTPLQRASLVQALNSADLFLESRLVHWARQSLGLEQNQATSNLDLEQARRHRAGTLRDRMILWARYLESVKEHSKHPGNMEARITLCRHLGRQLEIRWKLDLENSKKGG